MVENSAADASEEIPAVDNDPIVNLLHTLLGHLPSGLFETRAGCQIFVSELAERGVDLSLIFGTRLPVDVGELIMTLQGLRTRIEFSPGRIARYFPDIAPPFANDAETTFKALLASIRPALGELALGKLGLKPWTLYRESNSSEDTLRHLDNLALPRTHDSENPSLLLHGLGIDPQDDTTDNLLDFVNVDHKYFINGAGSGKTRLCLEAMCKKYAFYFTCAEPKGTLSNALAEVRRAHEIGSCDLSNVFKELAESSIPVFEQDLSVPPNQPLNATVETARMRIAQQNSEKAGRLLRCVLVVRLCLLAEYLDMAHTHAVIDTMESKRAWMHLQVQPHILCLPGIGDVFVSLADALQGANDDVVSAIADDSLGRIQGRLYPKVDEDNNDVDLKIPTVIDEAHEGLCQLPNAFLSPSSKDEMGYLLTRPFLREVTAHWSTFHSSHCNVQFIITGTDLSLSHHDVRERRPYLSFGKADVWTEAEFRGSFRERREQHAYLCRYLPSSLLDSPDGKVLLERIWYWLRGRYQFTASFVQYLLACAVLDGFRANVLLNMYIWGLAKFHPLDAMSQRYPMNLPGIPRPNHYPLEFENLDMDCIETLRYNVYHHMVRGLKPWYIEDATGSLLRFGLGQRVGLAEESSKILIYEPLILMAAFAWFNKLAYRPLNADPRERFRAVPIFASMVKSLRSYEPEWNVFENLLAYYFSQVFSVSTRSRLLDVFTFPCGDPQRTGNRTPSEAELELGSCRATLVSFYSKNGVHLEGSFDYHSNSCATPGYPGTLGVSAEDSVQRFDSPDILRHKTETPASILFAGDYMGPDLVFMLKLEKEGRDAPTYLWVAVQAKLQTTVSMTGRELTEAIDSVTPRSFFTSRKNNFGKQGVKKQDSDRFSEYMLKHQFNEKTLSALKDGLPEGKATPHAGTYSLLRVVAQFPRPLHLTSVFDRDEDDKHPLVTLDTENLKRTTQHQGPPDALQRFESDDAVAAKRKRNEPRRDETSADVQSDDFEVDLAVDIHDLRLEDSGNERLRKRARPDIEQ